jgi:DNA polymerase-3 subunit beta
MNGTTNRAALIAALAIAKRVIEKNGTMQHLACVRLVATKDELQVTATDLNIASTTRLAWKGADGAACVPASKLDGVMQNLEGEDVTLALADGGKFLTAKARKATQQMPTLPVSSFPKVPEPKGDWAKISGPALAEVLGGALPAVCKEETRFHLCGVFLISKGGTLRGIATDGHRLHAIERGAALTLGTGCTVPTKGARAVVAAVAKADDVEVAREHPHLHVRVGATTVSVKLIDGQFVPFEQVIPEHKRRVEVVASELRDAIQRAALVATNTRGVKLTFGKTLAIESDDPDGYRCTDEIDCKNSGPSVAVAMNPHYLLDMLEAVGAESVELRIGGELDPVELVRAGEEAGKAGGTVVLGMPMRL